MEKICKDSTRLSFPWYAQVPHDRRDVSCGSVTWENTSAASHAASPAVPGQLLVLPSCPRKSKWVKMAAKSPTCSLHCPFLPSCCSADSSPLAFFRFPNQYCNVPVTGVPMLVCQELDWLHQTFLKSFI